MSVTAILLAHEAAPDGTAPALYRWSGDLTLVEFHIEQIHAAGIRDIEVVLAADADRIISLLACDGVEPVISGSSPEDEDNALRVGAAAVPRGTTTAIIARVAEPRPASLYARLLEEHLAREATITRPSRNGRSGSPVAVNAAILEELRNLRDRHGLDGLLARHAGSIATFDCPDNIVTLHIESQQDCARAAALLADRLGG
jgi:CTP:molybdopterin cytidylyltransferase MocA